MDYSKALKIIRKERFRTLHDISIDRNTKLLDGIFSGGGALGTAYVDTVEGFPWIRLQHKSKSCILAEHVRSRIRGNYPIFNIKKLNSNR